MPSAGQMNFASIISGLTRGLAAGLQFKRQYEMDLAKTQATQRYRQQQLGLEERRMSLMEEKADEEADFRREELDFRKKSKIEDVEFREKGLDIQEDELKNRIKKTDADIAHNKSMQAIAKTSAESQKIFRQTQKLEADRKRLKQLADDVLDRKKFDLEVKEETRKQKESEQELFIKFSKLEKDINKIESDIELNNEELKVAKGKQKVSEIKAENEHKKLKRDKLQADLKKIETLQDISDKEEKEKRAKEMHPLKKEEKKAVIFKHLTTPFVQTMKSTDFTLSEKRKQLESFRKDINANSRIMGENLPLRGKVPNETYFTAKRRHDQLLGEERTLKNEVIDLEKKKSKLTDLMGKVTTGENASSYRNGVGMMVATGKITVPTATAIIDKIYTAMDDTTLRTIINSIKKQGLFKKSDPSYNPKLKVWLEKVIRQRQQVIKNLR